MTPLAMLDGERRASLPLNWPLAHGPLQHTGSLKSTPEDFQVHEVLPFEPSGTGEHIFLRIQKTGLNTEELAMRLARFAGVRRMAVGYAGMKDRQARTIQWFSVQLPTKPEPEWTLLNDDQVTLLASTRHNRKLKRGVLKGNGFVLILRQVSGNPDTLESRLARVRAAGVPNYFGPQRFGRGGQNLERASALFSGVSRPRNRHQTGLMYSTARAWLFNRVLGERVLDGSWNQPLLGDAFCLSGSRQYFVPEAIKDDFAIRIREHDMSPSGPLPGSGHAPVFGAVEALEASVCEQDSVLLDGLIRADVAHARRPLIVWPEQLQWQWIDPQTLRLEFELPAGSYATSLVGELMDTTEQGVA